LRPIAVPAFNWFSGGKGRPGRTWGEAASYVTTTMIRSRIASSQAGMVPSALMAGASMGQPLPGVVHHPRALSLRAIGQRATAAR
jgi:hypothetical protein